MDWLYGTYEITCTIGCFAFCGTALVATGWWTWLVWAPRTERVCAAFGVDEASTTKAGADDRGVESSRAA